MALSTSSLKKIKEKISRANGITIACHINPDGDCIGSLLALGLGLSALGKKVYLVSQDGVPLRYRKLPWARRIKRRAQKLTDMVISVDCNASEMIGRPYEALRKAADILEIDHHAYRRPFGNLSFVDTKAAAVGELVYTLLRFLKIGISQEIAQNILTSIIVETNAFRLPSVRPLTFRICSELVGAGVDYHRLSEMVYWSKTKQAAVLCGLCMSRLKLLAHNQIAWSSISREEIAKIKGREEDVDSVANDMLAIHSVGIAILFREKSRKLLRVSLRSKGRINIASLAYKYGGGGHFDSAGCLIANTLKARHGLIAAARGLLR